MKEKDKKIVDLQQQINELKQNLHDSQSQVKEMEENFNYKITNIQKVNRLFCLNDFFLVSFKSFLQLKKLRTNISPKMNSNCTKTFW
jgi:hypothetical protein